MTSEAGVVARLAELTASLIPAAGTSVEALERTRRLLSEALLSAQLEPLTDTAAAPIGVDSLASELTEDGRDALTRVVREVSQATRDPSLRMFRRTWPILAQHVRHAVPSWARGWELRDSFGPFESAEGALVWWDVRLVSEHAVVVDATSGKPLFALPRGTWHADTGAGTVSQLEIPAGSVWLSAPLFDGNAAAGSFAALRIREGSVVLSEVGGILGDQLRAPQGCVVTLRLEVDTDNVPQARTVGLPEFVEFAFAVGGSAKLGAAGSSGLELHGNAIRLTHAPAGATRYEQTLARLCFPFVADRHGVTIDDRAWHESRLSGQTSVDDVAWGLPVCIARNGDPAHLGEASGAGAFVLKLAAGLRTAIDSVARPMPLGPVTLVCDPTCTSALSSTPDPKVRREIVLRSASDGARIVLKSDGLLTFLFDTANATQAAEAITLGPLNCQARAGRPATAAGGPVSMAHGRAMLHMLRVAGSRRLLVHATVSQADLRPTLTFALSNALVRTAAPTLLQAGAVLDDQSNALRGGLLLHLPMAFLMPSLPDPYAANISRYAPRSGEAQHDRTASPLIARVRYAVGSEAALSFAFAGDPPESARFFLGSEDPPMQSRGHERERAPDYLPEVEALFPRTTGQGPAVFRLLDVSTRANLFGVGFGPATNIDHGEHIAHVTRSSIALRGLDLITPMHNVSAFTLPAFQWEPVYDLPNDGVLPFPSVLVSPTDGGAARFATPAATLVPLAPVPVFDALLTEYNGDSPLTARFTLPFGMVACAHLRRTFDHIGTALHSPRAERVSPTFSNHGLFGGLQLSLRAPLRMVDTPGAASPGLPGMAVQTDNGIGGYNVLDGGGYVDEVFNDRFANKRPLVPVGRIDFSGYGASIFSDWRHEKVKGTDVTQVKLEALVGRTSREVVQIRARLIPWGAILVRIITMERSGSGGVFRRDSGWIAASDAEYDLPGCTTHPGVVQKLKHLRRIRDTTNVYTHTYTTSSGSTEVKLAQVLFDADAQIEGVSRGANADGLVPTHDIVGYVQILPTGEELDPAHIDDLLAATGAIGGPIDCEIDIAKSGLPMRISRIEVNRTKSLGNAPQLVAIALGTTEIASAGEWTFLHRSTPGAGFDRLGVHHPIPLIRANADGMGIQPYRFADAGALHHPTNPDNEYAVLQATGAQRMLIPQPQLRWGDAALHGGSALLFADMYTLSSAGALFPSPDRCHPLPAGSTVRITGRGKVRLDIPQQPNLRVGEFRVGPLECKLSESAALRVRSRFQQDATIALSIDSQQQPDWSCSYGPVTLISDMDDLDEIVSTVGVVESSAYAAPRQKDPQLVFGGPLKPVQSIIQLLTMFGVPFAFDLSLTNTPNTYSFKSGWKYCFPKYCPFVSHIVEETLENGLGMSVELELRGRWGREGKVAKEIEKEFAEHALISTKGIPKGPDADKWHFSVECESKVLLTLASLARLVDLKAGGGSELEIGGEEGGGTKITYAAIYAGAIELEIPYLLSLSGTRTMTLGFEHKFGDKQVALRCGIGMEVELEFFSGLAGAAVCFELIGVIEPAEDYRVKAEGTVAVDLTVAFALSKTYEVEFSIEEHVKAEHFDPGRILP